MPSRMKPIARSILAFGLVFSASSPASAAGDWDWWAESNFREWRTDSLSWASQIHPSHTSPLILLVTTAPPPRELWCANIGAPDSTDLQIFDDLLSDWLRDYLDIPDTDPVPTDIIASFAPECDPH